MDKPISTELQYFALEKLAKAQIANGQHLGHFVSSKPIVFLAELKTQFGPALLNRPLTFTSDHHLGGDRESLGFIVYTSTGAYFTVVFLNPTGVAADGRFLFTSKGGFFKNSMPEETLPTFDNLLINIMALGGSVDYSFLMGRLGNLYRETVSLPDKDERFAEGLAKLISSFDVGFDTLEMALINEKEYGQRL